MYSVALEFTRHAVVAAHAAPAATDVATTTASRSLCVVDDFIAYLERMRFHFALRALNALLSNGDGVVTLATDGAEAQRVRRQALADASTACATVTDVATRGDCWRHLVRLVCAKRALPTLELAHDMIGSVGTGAVRVSFCVCALLLFNSLPPSV